MSEAKRQIGIKTRSVKRLAADLKSYLVERTTHNASLTALLASPTTESHQLKHAREFVDEVEATIADVRQRLREAVNGLNKYLDDQLKLGDAELAADVCITDARNMIRDVAEMTTVTTPVVVPVRVFKIAVYGGSTLTEDDALWQPTELLGEKLARAGYHVLTGGYIGSSESLSYGASRVSGCAIEGVTCASSFPNRIDHNYLTVQTSSSDVIDRHRQMITRADAFVVMPGGLGTLSKLVLTWNVSTIASSSANASPITILAWRQPWQSIINNLSEVLNIPQQFRDAIKYVDSVDHIVQELEQMKVEASASSSSSSAATA